MIALNTNSLHIVNDLISQGGEAITTGKTPEKVYIVAFEDR